jgi:hypothetical protein
MGALNHPTTMLNDEKQKVTNFSGTCDCDCSHKRKKRRCHFNPNFMPHSVGQFSLFQRKNEGVRVGYADT